MDVVERKFLTFLSGSDTNVQCGVFLMIKNNRPHRYVSVTVCRTPGEQCVYAEATLSLVFDAPVHRGSGGGGAQPSAAG